MRWRGERKSDNVEDRRGMSGSRLIKGGGIGAIILIVLGLLTGRDFSGLLQIFDTSGNTETTYEGNAPVADDSLTDFVRVVLGSTEDVWTTLFSENGQNYQTPKLVLFSHSVQSACGGASSAMGPFYCPGDNKVYIDLTFCDELRTRFQAPGNFAIAYVIAHEVGHHIQNLLGISSQVQQQRNRLSEVEYNKLSVKLELQADFLAGVWAHYAHKFRGIIEAGDLAAALKAAHAIGDDKLQMETQGYVVPDAFTHGSSEQRMYWFKKGFETGNIGLGEFSKIH